MRVRARKHVQHKGKNYQPGDTFDVPDHDAANLIQSGHVEEHKGDETGGESAAQPKPKT